MVERNRKNNDLPSLLYPVHRLNSVFLHFQQKSISGIYVEDPFSFPLRRSYIISSIQSSIVIIFALLAIKGTSHRDCAFLSWFLVCSIFCLRTVQISFDSSMVQVRTYRLTHFFQSFGIFSFSIQSHNEAHPKALALRNPSNIPGISFHICLYYK